MGYPQSDRENPPGGGPNRHPNWLRDGEASDTTGASPTAPATSLGLADMALDAGNAPDEFRAHPDWREPAPSITDAPSLGAGLRRAREASGRSLAELSSETRVHSKYLTALEQGEYSSLPSRVFTLGYVRAYASALGLDEQLAVERYKREAPGGETVAPLQAPTGVAFAEVRRHSPRVIAAVVALVVAVIGWNVFQRLNHMRAATPSAIVETPESWSLGAVPGQTGLTELSLTEAQPAPPDQTTPVLYVTPGLEAELLGLDADDPDGAAAIALAREAPPVQAAFNPRGAVYGAEAALSNVTIQATRPASLVVRLPDGRVMFARQLAAGESWRAPLGVSATVDVSDPRAFDIYMNGERADPLGAALTPLSQLNARAETRARQAAAQAEAEAAALARARQQAQAARLAGATAPASPAT